MNLELRLFVVTIGILVFLFIVRMLVKKNLSESNSVMWFIIGLVMLVSGLFPDIIAWVSLSIGIAYPPALLFLLSIIMLMLIALKNTIDLSIANARINEIASILSIIREENKKFKSILSEPADSDISLSGSGAQEHANDIKE